MDEEFARDGVLKEREGWVGGSSRAILNYGHQCLGPRNEDDPAMEQKASMWSVKIKESREMVQGLPGQRIFVTEAYDK